MVGLIGCQTPRLSSVPDGDSAPGDDAVAFAAWCGLTLLPWQEDLLRDMCRVAPDGRLAANEVVVPLARQNGKGEVLVARELYSIFRSDEKTIYHTAHLMDTAIDAQRRLWDVIEANEELMWWGNEDEDPALLPVQTKSNGKEALHFPALGKVAYFRTRTKKTARGLSVDLLIYDECYDLPNEVYAAMNSTTKAKPNAQKVFISSPVNTDEHIHGAIFSAKRWAGLDGADRVLFKEWSMPEGADPLDEKNWALANPSLGPVLQLHELRAEAAAAAKSEALMRSFLVESLGVGRWVPRDDELGDDFTPVFDLEQWGRLLEVEPSVTGECCVGLDVSPDGEHAAMCAALRTARGAHLSLSPVRAMDRDALVAGVKRAVDQNDPAAVVLDPKTPASTLVNPLEKLGVEPEQVTAGKVSAAWELLLLMVKEGTVTHDGDPRWSEMLAVARERESRSGSSGRALERYSGEVAGLNAAAFALWGLFEFGEVSGKSLVKKPREYVPPAAVSAGAVAGVRSMSF